jgi:hypothetical protein
LFLQPTITSDDRSLTKQAMPALFLFEFLPIV